MPYKLSILIVFCRKINMNGMINIVNKYVEMSENSTFHKKKI